MTDTTPEPADGLVRRAIDSVLEAIPDMPQDAPPVAARYQPWADTASPTGRNKRPLEELLGELHARVAASPGARAGSPTGRRPEDAFYDRFGSARRDAGRRRRRRGGGGTQPGGGGPAPPPMAPPATSGRRRRRRRSGRGGAPPGGRQPLD